MLVRLLPLFRFSPLLSLRSSSFIFRTACTLFHERALFAFALNGRARRERLERAPFYSITLRDLFFGGDNNAYLCSGIFGRRALCRGRESFEKNARRIARNSASSVSFFSRGEMLLERACSLSLRC